MTRIAKCFCILRNLNPFVNMWEPSWSGVLLLAVFCSEFHQSSLLKCGFGKEKCKRSGSCEKSLDCRILKYKGSECLSDKVDPGSYRRCDKGRNCYMEIDACDGVRDCRDGQDEKDCCPEGSFRCDFMFRKVCYTQDEICDGNPKCWDDSDEKDCRKCNVYEKSCDGGKTCYSESEACDGISYCQDNQDELDCPSNKTTYADDSIELGWLFGPAVIVPMVIVITSVLLYYLICRNNRRNREMLSEASQNAQSCQFQSTHSHTRSGLTPEQDRNPSLGVHEHNQPHNSAVLPGQHSLRPSKVEDRHRSASGESLQQSAPLLPPRGSSLPGDAMYPQHAPLLQPAVLPTAPVEAAGSSLTQSPTPAPSRDSAVSLPSYDALFPQK